MEFQETSCCGLREISSLSEHETPLDALHECLSHFYASNGEWVPNPAYDGSWCTSSTIWQPAPPTFFMPCSHILFTEAIKPKRPPRRYGRDLADLIRKLRLGSVTACKRAKNPNSGNTITVYVWTLAPRKIKSYVASQDIIPSVD